MTQNKAQLPSKVDGIMGLWYYAAGSAVPILNVLSNNTLLPRNMIGIWLQSTTPNGRSSGSGVAPGASSAGGEITFGGVDTTKFQGEITYVNCAGKRPWSVSVSSLDLFFFCCSFYFGPLEDEDLASYWIFSFSSLLGSCRRNYGWRCKDRCQWSAGCD